MLLADRTGGKIMNTIYIIIRTIKGSNYSTILRTYQQNEKQKAKAELKLLRKSDIIYDYKLKEYQKVNKYQEHWSPKAPTNYFYWINSTGWVEREEFSDDTFENRLIANFNAFPTRELAELGYNVSKISRLALLWQYANDCVHTPDWSSTTKNNFHFSLDIASDKIGVDRAYLFKRDCIYFKTRKQAEAFVKMYNKELIRLMSIK
jgi:hypothetical protein